MLQPQCAPPPALIHRQIALQGNFPAVGRCSFLLLRVGALFCKPPLPRGGGGSCQQSWPRPGGPARPRCSAGVGSHLPGGRRSGEGRKSGETSPPPFNINPHIHPWCEMLPTGINQKSFLTRAKQGAGQESPGPTSGRPTGAEGGGGGCRHPPPDPSPRYPAEIPHIPASKPPL